MGFHQVTRRVIGGGRQHIEGAGETKRCPCKSQDDRLEFTCNSDSHLVIIKAESGIEMRNSAYGNSLQHLCMVSGTRMMMHSAFISRNKWCRGRESRAQGRMGA